MATLLPRNMRGRNPHAQVQSLCRVARRALARADWLDELAARSAAWEFDPEYPEDKALHSEIEIAGLRRDARKLRAKAEAAAQELSDIAKANGITPAR